MDDALAALETAAIASGPILNVEDMFNDPHYQARGAFEEVNVDGGVLHIPSIAPRLVDTPGRTESPGPRLGEHTDSVLRGLLGLDDVEGEPVQAKHQFFVVSGDFDQLIELSRRMAGILSNLLAMD